MLFYIDKFTEYLGHVESARFHLQDPSIAMESQWVIAALLKDLSVKRNHALLFVGNLLNYAKTASDITPKHFENIVLFVQLFLDILPTGTHLEYLLACRIQMVRLGEQILVDGKQRFESISQEYRSFLNGLHQDLVKGQLGNKSEVYHGIENKAKSFFTSEEHTALLDLPMGRIADLNP